MSNEPQMRKRISIPKEFGPNQRQALADKVISFIQERTDSGKDVNNRSFAKYSADYIASPEFKQAGKSPDHVNLRLSNDMMDSLELLSHGSGYITIGYQADTESNNKAIWNEASDNGPSRKFVGISDSDLEKLIAEVNIEDPGVDNSLNTIASQAASNILKRLGF